MDEILTKSIWQIRKKIRANAIEPVTLIYTGGNTYQLFFSTKGCKFACTMCNYGFDIPINVPSTLLKVDEIISTFPKNAKILVLEASGSFLDETEMPKELWIEVLKKVAKLPHVKIVDIETHYTTVNDEKIQKIAEIFKNSGKEIEFEFGVESANESVLKIYNKYMHLPDLLDVIWNAHKAGIGADLNFLIGAPLLSKTEQIEDTLNSVYWTFENCPRTTNCVLFPLNIKSNTLVDFMFCNSKYELISHWEFIEMLSRIPHKYLDRISIAWWGNRFNIFDGKEEIIYPSDCPECHDILQDFYNEFYSNCDIDTRIHLLEEIQKCNCTCHKNFLDNLTNETQPSNSIEERFKNFRKWLKNQKI